jgi:hypothetical protein
MKKLLELIGLILVFTACNRNEMDNVGIHIKGKIVVSSQMQVQRVKADNQLTLADAKKVLVYSKYYYKLYDIVDGSFTAEGQIGSSVALIFLDANNKYIGNLAPQGLNILPLGVLSNGENTSIDLSNLTLVGTSVIPAHDPLGNEIKISDKEIQSLKAVGGYYEAIAKNIDANNDGIPDVLSNTQILVSTRNWIHTGNWGTNTSHPTKIDAKLYEFGYTFQIDTGKDLSFQGTNITLSGPTENPYHQINMFYTKTNTSPNSETAGFMALFSIDGEDQRTPFRDGIYTLTLDGSRVYTINYSNVDAKNNFVSVEPTLHTNNAGKLTSISLDYKLIDGTVLENPANMLTNVMIQLSDKNRVQLPNFNDIKLNYKTGFDSIKSDGTLDVSTLSQVMVVYDDLLGNQYFLQWY